MRFASFTGYGAYLVVRSFVALLQALPLETCHTVARGLAWFAADVLAIRSKVIDENLSYAFPTLLPQARRDLMRSMWEHLFLLLVEVAHAPRKIHETNWREFVEFRNGHDLCRLALEDRPSLLVSGHFGNFELGGYFLGILGLPTYTIARTLDNPHLDKLVNRFRGTNGQRMLPKKGAYDQILATLAAGNMMTFLADQYAGSKGCWVDFFNRPASAHKAIALLALEHQAPILVGVTRRLGRPLHFQMDRVALLDPATCPAEQCNVRGITQWYTQALESVIRLAPEQYWWVHRRWKDTRPAKKQARKAA